MVFLTIPMGFPMTVCFPNFTGFFILRIAD
jgi:hypothetical protein